MTDIRAHELDVGTLLSFDVGEDVTGMAVALLFRRPDGSELAVTAMANGTAVEYIVLVDDGTFDMPGKWKWQAYADLITWKGSSTADEFWVGERLATPPF